jgi:hypothetical protein
MFRVRKGEYVSFAANLSLAQSARRAYPELKDGHIKSVIQMSPEQVIMGRLYRGSDIQPDRANLQARNVGLIPGYCCLYHHTGGPTTSRCGSDIAR